jgi:hypothetical protein
MCHSHKREMKMSTEENKLVKAFMIEIFQHGKWQVANGKVYSEEGEAARIAAKLCVDWFDIKEARVVEIEAPVGYVWSGKGATVKRISTKQSVNHTTARAK